MLGERIRRELARMGLTGRGGEMWGVAVSGGADSVALLYLLKELSPELGIQLCVAHVNHQLRGAESEGDEQFVRELARRLGLVCHVERVRASEASDSGQNLEQACREARLDFFDGLRRTGVVARVATGHTMDDQAETVLFRLLRGAGPGGLAGVLPETREGLIRPMLGVRRTEIREWLRERGIGWREDSTNGDTRFARNRIRSGLLPQLEHEWNPRVSVLLAQTAELAREDEEYLAGEAERWAGELVTRQRDGAVVMEVEKLREAGPAMSRRVIRSVIGGLKGDLRGIEFEAIRRIEELCQSGEGSGRLQIPGVDVMRSFDWVRLVKMGLPVEPRNWSVEIPGAGRYRSPGGELVLEQGDTDLPGDAPEPAYNVGTCWLDLDRWAFPITFRNWRPGDSYLRVGQDRWESVKELFQSHRIPLWERRNWPMVAKDEEIFWCWRFGPAAAVASTGGSGGWRLRFCQMGRENAGS